MSRLVGFSVRRICHFGATFGRIPSREMKEAALVYDFI